MQLAKMDIRLLLLGEVMPKDTAGVIAIWMYHLIQPDIRLIVSKYAFMYSMSREPFSPEGMWYARREFTKAMCEVPSVYWFEFRVDIWREFFVARGCKHNCKAGSCICTN